MSDRSGWPTEVDYAWADGWGVGYCIALIEGVAPEVVLDLLVPDPPTGIVPVDAAWEWAEDEEMVQLLANPDHPASALVTSFGKDRKYC